MTRKERMLKMVKGEQIDFLPSNLEFVYARYEDLMNELGMDYTKWMDESQNHIHWIYPFNEACYYSSGRDADNQLEKKAVEMGIIRAHEDPQKMYDPFGTQWFKNEEGVRDCGTPMKSATEINDYTFPTAKGVDLFSHVKEGVEQYKDDYMIAGLHHLSFFERAFLLIGYEQFLVEMYTEPESVHKMLDKILEYNIGLADEYIKFGIDAIRIGDDYGTQVALQISPDMWRTFIKPRQAALYKHYRDAGVIILQHSCGCVQDVIPDMLENGLQILHPIQPLAMDINYLAKEYGKDLVFFGGIDTQQLLPFGTPEEVKAATKNCIEVLGANNKYIISSAQELMMDVPTANIMAMVEAINEYRER